MTTLPELQDAYVAQHIALQSSETPIKDQYNSYLVSLGCQIPNLRLSRRQRGIRPRGKVASSLVRLELAAFERKLLTTIEHAFDVPALDWAASRYRK